MDATTVINDMRGRLKGEPVFMAGSLVAAQAHGLDEAWSDVDIFCPTDQVLVATVQKLLGQGFTFFDRFERVWDRWLRYGFKHWHTNSMRMMSPNGIEVNLVYKLIGGHPTNSLAQVLESFDFGLLGVGYDLEYDQFRDLRSYLFPDIFSPLHPELGLPMMPDKERAWSNGFISQYNGLREAGRYAKYYSYGYDLSQVRDTMSQGYWIASEYHLSRPDDEGKMLGAIYESIATRFDNDEIEELIEAYKTLDFKDSLDAIMEALE